MRAFASRVDAALADSNLKLAVERTAGTAEAKRTLAVDAFPVAEAEARAGVVARTVVLGGVDDRPVRGDDPAVADVRSFVERQVEAWYQPARVDIGAGAGGRPVLQITFPPM